jgi:hypothetical protein
VRYLRLSLDAARGRFVARRTSALPICRWACDRRGEMNSLPYGPRSSLALARDRPRLCRDRPDPRRTKGAGSGVNRPPVPDSPILPISGAADSLAWTDCAAESLGLSKIVSKLCNENDLSVDRIGKGATRRNGESGTTSRVAAGQACHYIARWLASSRPIPSAPESPPYGTRSDDFPIAARSSPRSAFFRRS